MADKTREGERSSSTSPTLKPYQSDPSTVHGILTHLYFLNADSLAFFPFALHGFLYNSPFPSPSLILELDIDFSGFLPFPHLYGDLSERKKTLKMVVAMASGTFGVQALPRNVETTLLPAGRSTKGVFGSSASTRVCVHQMRKLSVGMTTIIPRASLATAVEDGNSETDQIPTPKVIIDLDSDPEATVVEITFGDRLGALLDTMSALKNLGLNVVKANVFLDSSGKHNTFAITRADNGRKVEDPELLEAIRLTIINNLIEYHPESSARLAMGAAFGIIPPPQQVDIDIATHVKVVDDGPDRSLLYVDTADRPGLLVDIVRIVTDINVSIESGEFDTEGLLAKAKFHVSYKGKALIKPLQQVVANSLRYFLRRPSTDEGSF